MLSVGSPTIFSGSIFLPKNLFFSLKTRPDSVKLAPLHPESSDNLRQNLLKPQNHGLVIRKSAVIDRFSLSHKGLSHALIREKPL